MIRKRGNKWCVVHGHPKKPGSKTDKPEGAVIKCYSIETYGEAGAKRRAQAMHTAIVISQNKQMQAVKGQVEYTLQEHQTPEGVHLDLRYPVDDFDVAGMKLFTTAKSDTLVVCAKDKHPRVWMHYEGKDKGGMYKILDSGTLEFGAQKPFFREMFFTGKNLNGRYFAVLEDDVWQLRRAAVDTPYVLSAKARRDGWLPPFGESGLPSDVEQQVEESKRFWEYSHKDALKLRAAVAESYLSGIAKDDWQQGGEFPCEILSVESKSGCISQFPAARCYYLMRLDKAIFVLSGDPSKEDCQGYVDLKAMEKCKVLDSVSSGTCVVTKQGKGWTFELQGITIDLYKDYDGSVLYTATYRGRMKNSEKPKKLGFEVKSLSGEPEYVIGGIVYHANKKDYHGDWATPETLWGSLKHFMLHGRNLSVNWQTKGHFGENQDLPIIEAFQAEEDTTKGGKPLPKGSIWLSVYAGNAKEVWKAAKSGELNGFSFEGLVASDIGKDVGDVN